MYKVIGHPRSRTMRVLWMLEELGQPYEILSIRPGSSEAMAHNPSGKVPAPIVEGHTIIDSVAIMQFLADRHGQLTYPAGSIERAQQDSFTQFACDEVDGPLWTAAKHSFALPEELRVSTIKPTAKAEFARAMAVLEVRLGDKEFVMGNAITLPDILLGHCAGWAESAKFDLPQGPVADYFTRLRARPALRRAMEKSAEKSAEKSTN